MWNDSRAARAKVEAAPSLRRTAVKMLYAGSVSTAAVRRYRYAYALGLILVVAFALRVNHLTDPPFDFQPTRQFHSVVIAHWLYIESVPSAPAWQIEVARLNFQDEPFLEPPIMEMLAVAGYRLLGGEYLWVPRLLSSLFWLVGAIPLYLLARQMSSRAEAVVASAIYLLLPFGVQASRSFQPDPLMVTLLIAAVWTMFRWDAAPSRGRLAWTIALAASAIFVKPSSVFMIYAAFVALTVRRLGLRRALVSREMYLFGALGLLPILLYSGYGFFVGGFLRGQEEARFLPQLLLTLPYWKGWVLRIGEVVGYVPYLAAFGAALLMTRGTRFALLLGLWVGYVMSSLFFTYNTPTHSYYHLPLLPLVALSLTPLVGAALRRERWRSSAIASLIALGLISVGISIRQLDDSGEMRQIEVAREIGQKVSHSTRTLLLARYYGLPLRYYGELAGFAWPSTEDLTLERVLGRPLTAEQRFDRFHDTLSPDFFVVTRFDMLQNQPDLREYLKRFPVLEETAEYQIFDLRRPND
jgi:hypothetical protein